MNVRTQIILDNRVVKPILWVLNLLVRLVGAILGLDHDLGKEFKTIAICKYKGMGSIIQSSPLLGSIRKRYPNAKLVYVSTVANKSILEKLPQIDELVLLDDRSALHLLRSYPAFVSKLIRLRIGVFVDLEIYSNFSSLTTTLSMARNRFGFYLRSSQYRLGVYTHMMFFNTRYPIMQSYLQMGRLLGINNPEAELTKLPFESKDGISGDYLVINANASDLRIERRWPADNFVSLIHSIQELTDTIKIVLIGSPSEAQHVQSIINKLQTNERIINLAGRTTIDQLIGLISKSRLMITNDTGPMHIAAAQGTKTVALFGPCSPEQYGTLPTVYPIYQKIYCSPCVHEFQQPPCFGDNQCMKQISVETVMKRVEDALNSRSTSSSALTSENVFRKNSGKPLGRVIRKNQEDG